jgi:protein O-mannosyl-transferase
LPRPPPSAAPLAGRRATLLAAGLIVVGGLAAYADSLRVPFLLDDDRAIVGNATLRSLADIGRVLSPPPFSGVSGRPLLNLTYALNYAAGGLNPAGYHLANLAIHLAAALALFGLLRRTLRSPRLPGEVARWADEIAVAAAAIWTVHPLLTEAVTYVSERAESLMGLCYLVAFYAFARWAGPAEPRPQRRWAVLSVAAVLVGLVVKEVMVTAPLLLFAFDAVFVSEGPARAWRARRGFYAALALGAAAVLGFSLATGTHSIGFRQHVGVGEYFLTECRAVALYLRLSFWPRPLVFDYGPILARPSATALACFALLAALGAATLALLRVRPAAGFVGAWFFVILAPTSSFVPVALQPVAESRMYLPLAALAAAVAAAAYRVLGARARWLLLAAFVALAGAAYARNARYRDPLSIWSDTVAKRPRNPRAQDALGDALASAGRMDEAAAHLRIALALTPNVGRIHYDLGRVLAAEGRGAEAAAQYALAARFDPGATEPGNALGAALFRLGRPEEARRAFEAVLRDDPDNAAALGNLGDVLLAERRPSEAESAFGRALRVAPDFAAALRGRGLAEIELGQPGPAQADFEAAVRLDPRDAESRLRLGNLLAMQGSLAPAIEEWEAALRLRPADAEAENNLATALAEEGRTGEAIAHYEAALRIDPGYARARANLADLRARLGPAAGGP